MNSLLDLTKLRIFVAIATSGSFTRAAEQLALTQPTVSQQLAVLETQIGVAATTRATHGGWRGAFAIRAPYSGAFNRGRSRCP